MAKARVALTFLAFDHDAESTRPIRCKFARRPSLRFLGGGSHHTRQPPAVGSLRAPRHFRMELVQKRPQTLFYFQASEPLLLQRFAWLRNHCVVKVAVLLVSSRLLFSAVSSVLSCVVAMANIPFLGGDCSCIFRNDLGILPEGWSKIRAVIIGQRAWRVFSKCVHPRFREICITSQPAGEDVFGQETEEACRVDVFCVFPWEKGCCQNAMVQCSMLAGCIDEFVSGSTSCEDRT